MNEHAEFGLLDEFVLGTLDAAGAARVARHVRTCAACRAEYDELRCIIDVLPQALTQQPPAPALRDRIFAAIDAPAASNGPSASDGLRKIGPSLAIGVPDPAATFHTIEASGAARWRTTVIRGLAAALLVAVAGDALLAVRLAQPRTQVAIATPTAGPTPVAAIRANARKDAAIAKLKRDLAAAQTQTGADRLVAALRTGRVYAIDGAVGSQSWHLTIVQPRHGARALIYSGTPDAPGGKTYRTWVLRSGRTVDVGELSPGKPTTLEMPMALEPGDVVAFSREPVGARSAPTAPFLMQLKITQ